MQASYVRALEFIPGTKYEKKFTYYEKEVDLYVRSNT